MLILHGETDWDSPFVFSAYVTLREKGVSFEERALDLTAGEQREESFAARSLSRKVPTIDHDGFWLSESLAIVEYLEEAFPPPAYPAVLPRAIQQRARAREIVSWLRSGTEQLRMERPTTGIFFEPVRTPLGDRARDQSERLIGLVERELQAGSTTIFSSWTLCDAELALALHRLLAGGDPVPSRVRAYAEAAWARPSVRAFVEHERPARH